MIYFYINFIALLKHTFSSDKRRVKVLGVVHNIYSVTQIALKCFNLMRLIVSNST